MSYKFACDGRKVTKIRDSGNTVDLIYLDFSEAFNSVSNRSLVQILKASGPILFLIYVNDPPD